jgi:hypothetical protein
LAHEGYEQSLGKTNGVCMALAIMSDDLEIVQALVEAKAKPYNDRMRSLKDLGSFPNNALLTAAALPDRFSSSLGHFGLLRLVFNSLSQEDLGTPCCTTALEIALVKLCKYGTRKMFDLLRVKGVRATVDMLVRACSSNNEELVRVLLDARTYQGRAFISALRVASSAGHVNIVRLLRHERAKITTRANPLGRHSTQRGFGERSRNSTSSDA